jgi:hypothetical protein
LLVELAHRAVTPIPATTKSFDDLVEGLGSENNRGDKTPLELFLEGIRYWNVELEQYFRGA